MPYAKYKDLGDKQQPGFQQKGTSLQQDGRITHLQATPHVDPCPDINSVEQRQELISKHKVCVIDVYADWCGPCKMIAPKFLELAQRYYRPGHCVLAKEDAGKQLGANVSGLPTFIFFKDGQQVNQVVGADVKRVEQILVELLSQH